MKFYDRETELSLLNELYTQAKAEGRMTVLTGRRRTGKTLLSIEFSKQHPHLYLFVARKAETLLCQEFTNEIQQALNVPIIGEIRRFKDIFRWLLELSLKRRFTLIVDEFQEFYSINPSVFSEVQNLWDSYKRKSKLNLIFVGSIYSLMTKIFQDAKEPLFNRADRQLVLQPFSIKTMASILDDYNCYTPKRLFDFYVMTGGMPVYMDWFLSNKATNQSKMSQFVFQQNSPFLNEGRNVLVEELGKDYSTYFSILELISTGKTARTEIGSILEKEIGGFLDRLEKSFSILEVHKPINARPQARLQKYKIRDNFLQFWFRFVYRHRTAIEIQNFAYLQEIFKRDYSTYCGTLMENFFKELLAASGKYNGIGSYWEKGNQNEIDIVAINDLEKQILIGEVKLNRNKINLDILRQKASTLIQSYPGYSFQYYGFSFEDIETYL